MSVVLSGRLLVLIIIPIVSLLYGCSSVEFKLNYSSEEITALLKFRPLISDILDKPSMQTDEFLIRWIRDAGFDLQKASQKLTKSMAWRKSYKIDALNIQDLNSTFPIYMAGYDKTGSPLYILPFGTWDLRKMILAGKRAALNRHADSLLDLGLKHTDRLRQEGQNVTQWIVVVDMAGLNLREHLCLACIPFYLEFMNDYENNYPETLKNMVAINAPKIFEPVLNLAKPIMSPGTRRGLRIFDLDKEQWQAWFRSICSPEQLLTSLGGSQNGFTAYL